ncbi:MAG: hypothetical protein WC120_05775 [Parcubacteria group bacterium]
MSKIDNKKIPTVLGTVIIVIIAITVGALVWKYEKIKNQDEAGMQSKAVEFVKSVEEKQNPQREEKEESIDTSDWKVCRSEKYNYEFKYPSDWIIGVPVNRMLTNCEYQKSFVISPGIQIPENNLYHASFSINENEISIDEFIKSIDQESIIEKEMLINNRKAIVTRKDGPRGTVRIIKIFDKKITYGFGAEFQSNEKLFDAFVSTFKILE